MATDVTRDESDKSGDESEAGVAADVTGDESESGGMSPAQEVEEEAVETWSTHVRKHGKNNAAPNQHGRRLRLIARALATLARRLGLPANKKGELIVAPMRGV